MCWIGLACNLVLT